MAALQIRIGSAKSFRAGEDVNLGVKAIEEEIKAPAPFTPKIPQILNRHKIVTSLKDPYGGFFCNEDQLNLYVLEIANAVDGAVETIPSPNHLRGISDLLASLLRLQPAYDSRMTRE